MLLYILYAFLFCLFPLATACHVEAVQSFMESYPIEIGIMLLHQTFPVDLSKTLKGDVFSYTKV